MVDSSWCLIPVLGIVMAFPSSGLAAEDIKPPPPATKGGMPLAEALQARRTVRHFATRTLNLTQRSQLLWEADGVSDPTYQYNICQVADRESPIRELSHV